MGYSLYQWPYIKEIYWLLGISKVIMQMNFIIRITRKLKRILRKYREFSYVIGDYKILLPKNHKLPDYQWVFTNYDKKIKIIIQSIEKFSNNGTIIDIGANVGDTAVYIRSFSKSKIICVEGDKIYLKYLKKNVTLSPNMRIYPVFLRGRNYNANYNVMRDKGTAKLEQSYSEILPDVDFISLSEILKENNIQPASLELIKIDTDGFDFDILLENEQIIKEYKPNLYFEYDICFNQNDDLDSLKVIKLLESLGYGFVVYDNFGNLMNIVEGNCEQEFIKINHYIASCRKHGGGIGYCDIFATKNEQIRRDIWKNDK